MSERYIPKGGNGGARAGAGRPKNSISAATKEALKQAQELAARQQVLRGELPHILLLKWAQTGIMEQVEEDWQLVKVPIPGPADSKKVKYETKRVAFPKRDANGNLIMREHLLAPQLRMLMAQSIIRTFAPNLTDKKVDTLPEQKAAQEKADAQHFEQDVLRDMPVEGKPN